MAMLKRSMRLVLAIIKSYSSSISVTTNQKFKMNEEPIEKSQSELFPVGLRLSELVGEFSRGEVSLRLVASIVEKGELTPDFYAEISAYVEKIKAANRIDCEQAVDGDEKHALQNRERLLHQVGLIVLLLDTYWQLVDSGHEDLAELISADIISIRYELIEQLVMLLQPQSNAPTLIHVEYFESLLKRKEELILP